MHNLFEAVVYGLLLLLPLVNPLATLALFIALSSAMTKEQRDSEAKWSAFYIFIIMMVAYYAGQIIMDLFGISIPGLRIAGGMIVSYIGFRMLFPSDRVEDSVEVEHKTKQLAKNKETHIAFIPMAMPNSAGPGTIAMIIATASNTKVEDFTAPWVMVVSPILIFLIISLIIWICLHFSTYLMKLLGKSGIESISRIMGFLLVCIGVQFVINGVVDAGHHFFK